MRIAVLCVLVFFSSLAAAWSEALHVEVCENAYARLSLIVKARVDAISRRESFAQGCAWPDAARKTPKWEHTYAWHFADRKAGTGYFDLDQWKAEDEDKGDVLRAIGWAAQRLAANLSTREERWDALRFLGHFVADLHQPLHAGYPEDKGGNDFVVTWHGKKTFSLDGKERRFNLHGVWDHLLVADGAKSTKTAPDAATLARWSASLPFAWYRESVELLPSLYEAAKSHELGAAYAEKFAPIARTRLLQAGVRLATMLERVLGVEPAMPQSAAFDEAVRLAEALASQTKEKRSKAALARLSERVSDLQK